MSNDESVELLNSYERLLYARGFLLTSGTHNAPHDDWRRFSFGIWNLSYDPKVRFGSAGDGDRWAFVLGRAVDVDSETQDNNKIARTLLAAAGSLASVYDYLDALSGRYLVAWGTATSGFVTSDACGVRSIFYHAPPGRTIVSSHAELAAMTAGVSKVPVGDREWRANLSVYYLPGDLTPYTDIHFLTPNLELDLNANRVRRYYPREPLAAMSVHEAARELVHLLSTQIGILAEDSEFVMSLSAGIDSRTTLAVMKPFLYQTTFFTYTLTGKNPSITRGLEIDREVSSDMARILGLDHMILEVVPGDLPQDLNEVIQSNSFFSHARSTAAAYMESFPADALHLRSSLVEIGRSFYRNRESTLTPERMASTFARTTNVGQELIDQFETWASRAQFGDAHGLDPYDLFYWEHRMGTWHAGVVLESDVAFDTFILFNSRRVLEVLLSVPLSDRLSGAVVKEAITRAWPTLDYWPINAIRVPYPLLHRS
jgi:hypothetical protein